MILLEKLFLLERYVISYFIILIFDDCMQLKYSTSHQACTVHKYRRKKHFSVFFCIELALHEIAIQLAIPYAMQSVQYYRGGIRVDLDMTIRDVCQTC